VGIVIEAQQRAVLQPHPRRPLEFDRHRLKGISNPADFEVSSVERAVLDCTTVIIRLHLTFRIDPPHSRTVWKTGASGFLAVDEEIARAPIKRPVEFRIGKP